MECSAKSYCIFTLGSVAKLHFSVAGLASKQSTQRAIFYFAKRKVSRMKSDFSICGVVD